MLRPAYGISFARVAALQAGASAWTHTFAIEIPDIDELVTLPIGPCERTSDKELEYCLQFMNATHAIYAQHARDLRSAKENMNMAITLVPKKIDATASRKKRGLFDFVGQFAKSFFGVGTSQEVAEIAKHVVVAEQHTRTTRHFRKVFEFPGNPY